MKSIKIIAAALALCLLFAVSAAATSWEAFDDVAVMMNAADLVIVGTVIGTEDSYITALPVAEKLPYTYTSIKVTKVIKGGVMVGVGDIIREGRYNHRDPKPDDPVVEWPDIWLEVGQEYLLFLRATSGEFGVMINPWQGHYIVDGAGKLTAHPDNTVKIASIDALPPFLFSVNFKLILPKKFDTYVSTEILIDTTVYDFVVGSTVSEVFQKALTKKGYTYTLDEAGGIATIADSNDVAVFPFELANVNGISEALMHYLLNGNFVEPNAVVKDGDSVTVSIGELIADPPEPRFCPGNYVGLFGKYTDYPSNFWNWFKFIALFGWIWMWFI